jgi:hemerythrin-like domain-containing protein
MLKRHPALQDLSRDHHLFLLQVRHIRWLIAGHDRADPLETVIQNLLEFWEQHGSPHLTEEETVLFPFYRDHADDPDTNDLLRRLEIDHNWMREKFEELADLPRLENAVPLLRSMGDYVERHVRHEEREVFQQIQAHLSEDDLAALAEKSLAFRTAHRTPDVIGPATPSVPDVPDTPSADE